MFINYVKERKRETSFNLSAARLLIGLFLVVRLLSLGFEHLQTWPGFFFEDHPHAVFLPSVTYLRYLWVEQSVAIVALLGFALGYRVALSGFLAVALIAHLQSIHYMISDTNEFFPALYVIAFLTIYRHEDELSLDHLRDTKRRTLASLNRAIRSPERTPRSMAPLTWSLLTLAIVYFFTGFPKLVEVGLDWARAENLRSIVLTEALMHDIAPSRAASVLIESSWLPLAGGVATLIFEAGFLPFVLMRLPIWPFALGLSGMHLSLALTMGIIFQDPYVLFAMFLPWDSLYQRVASRRRLDLLYDERCFFCARIVYVLKRLDVHDVVRCRSQSDASPDLLARAGVDLSRAMYAFRGDETFEGYEAFRLLLAQLRVFFPLVWLMRTPPVAAIGRRVYAYVAANRRTLFVCSVGS